MNAPGYFFILLGLLLSLISALVPHFDAGYTLMLSVFAAGILPYLVYSVAVTLRSGTLITAIGFFIVVIHAWLVMSERIIGHADYSSGMIFYLPMVMALAMLPLAITTIRRASKF